jgi:hypothetical protein
MEDTNLIEYNISFHAEERYAMRIMEKDNKNEINRFVAENRDKIKKDINKMIHYVDCIYVGQQSQKDGKGKVLNVYLNDCWVVLVDTKSNNVVTLYKIDLQLGDEFNKQYIFKMMEKLSDSKRVLEDTQLEVLKESNMYQGMIDDAEAQIREYKMMIKNLEELCIGYKSIINNNNVKVSQANRMVADCVNALVNKREF